MGHRKMKYKTLNLNDSKLRELFELKSNEDLILTEVKKVNGNSVQIEVAVVKQESKSDVYDYINLNKKAWETSRFTQENSNYIGKIIDDAFNALSKTKTLDRKLDIDDLGITISSGKQRIKLTNENISSIEIKEDGTIILKAPQINFI